MQSDYLRKRHSVSLLYAHLVVVTKYRRCVLNDAMLTDCQNTLAQVCEARGAQVVEFNGEPDHLHLFICYPPVLAITDLVHRLKGATARKMRQDHTGHCNQARMYGHFWKPSYFAAFAGGAPLSIIKQYIQNQTRPV